MEKFPNCPECGKETVFVGKQEYPAKYNLKPRVLVECLNPECRLCASATTLDTIRAAQSKDEEVS